MQYQNYNYTQVCGILKGNVSLQAQPIAANESTHTHALDEVWGHGKWNLTV